MKELNLYGNKIKFIDALTNNNLKQLKILILGKNLIDNLNPLNKCTFKDLEKLDLFDNKITNIDNLVNAPFKESINELDLSFNKLKSVTILIVKTDKEDVFTKTFSKLKDLRIEGNEYLDYSQNNIKNIYDTYKIKYTYNAIL